MSQIVKLKGADATFNGNGGFGRATHPWEQLFDGDVNFYAPVNSKGGGEVKHFAYQCRKVVESMIGKGKLPKGTEVKCQKAEHNGTKGYKVQLIRPAATVKTGK